MFPANGSCLVAPPIPRAGPGLVQFPDVVGTMKALRLPVHAFPVAYWFASGHHALPPAFVLALRRSPVGGGPTGARAIVQPAARLPACSRVDTSGISQVPRRSVLCLCPAPRPRPDRQPHGHGRCRRCYPRSHDGEGSSKRNISRLIRGFGTCCLRFKSDVAAAPARLASGWLARLCREGVEPPGSR